MSHLDHQRILLDLALQLGRGEPLSEEQQRFLAIAFYRIGTGENANKVLSVSIKRGERLSAVIARRRMSMILHWVAGAVQPDPGASNKPMSVEAACALAVTTIVPVAKAAFPGADNHQYEADYIFRCWSDPAYAHMRSLDRGWFDPDFPYYAAPGNDEDLK